MPVKENTYPVSSWVINTRGLICFRGTDTPLNCENGPAIIDESGNKKWVMGGRLHREDGPASLFVEHGSAWFWIHGEYHPFDQWCKVLNKTDEEITFLKLKYGHLLRPE